MKWIIILTEHIFMFSFLFEDSWIYLLYPSNFYIFFNGIYVSTKKGSKSLFWISLVNKSMKQHYKTVYNMDLEIKSAFLISENNMIYKLNNSLFILDYVFVMYFLFQISFWISRHVRYHCKLWCAFHICWKT